MPAPPSERTQIYRKALRAFGLRRLLIWVPDTRSPGFEAACREQAARAAVADATDNDLAGSLDAAFDDVTRN